MKNILTIITILIANLKGINYFIKIFSPSSNIIFQIDNSATFQAPHMVSTMIFTRIIMTMRWVIIILILIVAYHYLSSSHNLSIWWVQKLIEYSLLKLFLAPRQKIDTYSVAPTHKTKSNLAKSGLPWRRLGPITNIGNNSRVTLVKISMSNQFQQPVGSSNLIAVIAA